MISDNAVYWILLTQAMGYNNPKFKSIAERYSSVRDFIEAGEPGGPFGAKSIGEASVVPAAPAVMNAVVNALNVEINDLPYRWGGGVKNKDYYLQAK